MDIKTRTKIDSIWQSMWDNGMADPKTNIMQITYLLFIKMLDDAQIKKEANASAFGTEVKDPTFPKGKYMDDKDEDGNVIGVINYDDLRWHNFVTFETVKMYHVVKDYVFRFLKDKYKDKNNAYTSFMDDAKLEIPKATILDKVIKGLNDKDLNLDNKEIMGDAYEYLLSKLAINGDNGQFRTPRHIINMMVQLMKPKIGDVICDPAMGSAGFLIESAMYIEKNQPDELNKKENRELFNNKMFYGYDTDPDMLRIGAMNMTLHEVSNPQIQYRNSLTDDNKDANKYTLVLANPPFKGSLDINDVSNSLKSAVDTKQTELLFLALFLRSLKIGGRCASVVPAGVLNNTNSKAYTTIRKELVENQELQAIIYLPSGVFEPYSGVQTAIIIFKKTDAGGTNDVWLYDLHYDGFTLDKKRTEDDEHNDIPDLIKRFNNLEDEKKRTRKEQSFFIKKEDIVKNDYVFSLNKYQERIVEKKVYRPSKEILADILSLNNEISNSLEEVKRMLEEQEDSPR